MAFDISGAIIQSSNSGIATIANNITGLTTNTSGFVNLNQRPYFVAQKTGESWNTYNSANWTTMVFNYAVVNNGNHYNTTNGRFTAPVNGTYYFNANAYTYKANSPSASTYTHPIFIVNGSSETRHSSFTTNYRLRTRTYYDGGYSSDTEINDMFYLFAGDYVQYYVYANAGIQYYGSQTMFCGFLVG